MGRARQKNKPEVDNGLSRLQALRAVGGLVAVMAIVIGVVCSLERVKSHVYALPEYNPQVSVELADAPAWVDSEGWRPRILSAIKLPAGQKWLDAALVQQVASEMQSSGYVSRVKRVTQCPDGRVQIACEFRRPIAIVQTQHGFVFVDKDGYRLPEIYQDLGSGWMCITGVESPAPDVGHRFSGEDVAAGVKLAGLIFEQDFAQRITGIDMGNFRGRRDKRANHICLRTRDGGKIDWGSAIGEEIEEPAAKDKIRTIALYFKKGSPQAQVDVSVYRNGWIEPAAAEPVLMRTADAHGRAR